MGLSNCLALCLLFLVPFQTINFKLRNGTLMRVLAGKKRWEEDNDKSREKKLCHFQG